MDRTFKNTLSVYFTYSPTAIGLWVQRITVALQTPSEHVLLQAMIGSTLVWSVPHISEVVFLSTVTICKT